MFDNSLLALGIVIAVIFFASQAMLIAIILRLKNVHPETYNKMGKPSIFFNLTSERVRLILFFIRREDRKLSDPQLSRNVNYYFALYSAAIATLVAAVVLKKMMA